MLTSSIGHDSDQRCSVILFATSSSKRLRRTSCSAPPSSRPALPDRTRSAQTQPETKLPSSLDSATRIIAQIKRADYEGDRAAAQRLPRRTRPPSENKIIASSVLYWRRFRALAPCHQRLQRDPDSEGLGRRLKRRDLRFQRLPRPESPPSSSPRSQRFPPRLPMYLNMKDLSRVQELIQQSSPLLQRSHGQPIPTTHVHCGCSADPLVEPPERGGGRQSLRSLQPRPRIIRKGSTSRSGTSWGEPDY